MEYPGYHICTWTLLGKNSIIMLFAVLLKLNMTRPKIKYDQVGLLGRSSIIMLFSVLLKLNMTRLDVNDIELIIPIFYIFKIES